MPTDRSPKGRARSAHGRSDRATIPLRPRGDTGPAPLSFAQERLRFLNELESDSASYNESLVLRLRGAAFDVRALEQSLHIIEARHEILRTTFPVQGGNAVQQVMPPGERPLPLVDLSELPGDRQQEALRLARALARRPFDLVRGPLFEGLVVRLHSEEHLFILACHHLVADHWSMAVFLEELGACYRARVANAAPALGEPGLQYADFAVWQRQAVHGSELARLRAQARRTLAGAPLTLDLPTDHPRPPVQSFVGGHVRFAFDPTLTEQVKAFARRERCTSFMVLLAGFQALLHRYSGQGDLIVGTPVAGRDHPALERLLGFFLNTLAIRSRTDGKSSFRSFLAQVRESCLQAFANRELPFEMLVQELQPPRDLSRSPVVQAMFILQNAPTRTLDLPGVEVEPVPLDLDVTKMDLYLFMEEVSARLGGVLRYRADLFDAETAQQLAAGFESLLSAAIAHPDKPLGLLPLLAPGRRDQLLVRWNATDETWGEGWFHQLFERQARLTPESVAIEQGGRRLSYRELDERSSRLAGRLRRLGAAPERLVAVCLDRSPATVVALLAVLKTGAAYLPLDPALPRARLHLMLEDADPALLLTDRSLQEGWAGLSVPVALLEDPSGPEEPCPAPAVFADNLAYVLYTSGSTGRPKGIGITHRALTNFLHSMQREPGLSSDDIVLAVTTVSFDIAVLELFLPLMTGARIVLVDTAVAADGAALAELLKRSGATVMQATPSSWSMLLEAGWPGTPGLKVLTGGEALTAELAGRLRERCAELWNMYGPTETTVWSLVAPVPASDEAVSLGRPIANTTAYVLDWNLEPVPVVVPGGLYLGGDGLARGYLNRPGLTAERFLPDPFRGGGRRLYFTGDLVRWKSSGQLEYLGRSDNQVKVRGFRIELGEIETVLARQPGVHQAAVVARAVAPGDVRLVAFVVPEPGAGIDVRLLRAALQRALPEYMVPSGLQPIERMPLTPNSKIDRQALTPLAVCGEDEEGSRQQASTPAEQIVADAFAEVLGRTSVGREETFFDLGGHSLLATRLLSRLRQIFNVELPMRVVFEAPTPQAMATAVGSARGVAAAAQGPRIARTPEAAETPLSLNQQRLWFLNDLLGSQPVYNVVAAARLVGSLQVSTLERAIGEVVRRHEVLRMTFARDAAGEPVQRLTPFSDFCLTVEELPGAAPGESARRAAEEAALPLDLERGPLLRATLLRVADDEHVLVLVVHHIVFDGWSAGVLLREVSALYAAHVTGQPSPLAELPVQYRDYALWQRARLRGPVLEGQLGYWRRQLAGAPPLLQMRTDFPRPALQSFAGADHRFEVPADLSAAVLDFSRRNGVTAFMACAAAYALVLRGLSGQDDLTVGTDLAGRTCPEIEPLIGFFANQVVLRFRLSGDPTVPELLAQIREVSLGAFDHQDVPFDRLVEELRPERSPAYAPLFQAKLVLQDVAEEDFEVPGLALHLLPVASRTSRFDLLLNLSRSPMGMNGTLNYNSALFLPETVAALAEQFLLALQAVVSGRNERVDEIQTLLAQADQQRRLAREDEVRRSALSRLPVARRRAGASRTQNKGVSHAD